MADVTFKPEERTIKEDARHRLNGRLIPTASYSDQPYFVIADDGAWLGVATTGSGAEGAGGQHVVSMRSLDFGKTWEPSVDVEPADGPEASYAVLLKTPYGRIYCFYNHNTDNVRRVRSDDASGNVWISRVDSLGHFVFKYTDDCGRSWSCRRFNVPSRAFEIDKNNADSGELRYFWNVGKPFVDRGKAFVSLHKVGGFGKGFFTSSEGVLLASKNILFERNPEKIEWETLPDGERGLRSPPGGGPISEEQSYVVLSDGTFAAVYRSTGGHPVESYSRDRGHTWSEPKYRRFPDGRLFKHPRAANFQWKCQNGKYLYWYHNHGGRDYDDRNPAWLCGGIEQDSPDGKILIWSQPEIFLYDDDPLIRMSYPDLLECEGNYYITETQKSEARLHLADTDMLERLWAQLEQSEVKQLEGAIFSCGPGVHDFPTVPNMTVCDSATADFRGKNIRNGFTIELRYKKFKKGDVLATTVGVAGMGMLLSCPCDGQLRLEMRDAETICAFETTEGELATADGRAFVIVDAGPRIIEVVSDGKLCDGGKRQFGWGRFSPNLRHCNGNAQITVSQSVSCFKRYDRAVSVSECVLASRKNSVELK